MQGSIFKNALEVTPAFLLAGVGMVASGGLLDRLSSSWQVFRDCPALLILVPALLGLKGNLEMTLGARLGTHAHAGELHGETLREIIKGNVMAVQCQAIIVGAAAAALAVGEQYISTGRWDQSQALFLASCSTTAASLASGFLSFAMIGIVLAASRNGLDPDNITAPLAGMLGDFCTLSIVCVIARVFWDVPSEVWLYLLMLCHGVIAVICYHGAYRSKYTVEIMQYGWYPVLLSMLLSNMSGPISERAIRQFRTFALFQVVMNGAGGNLGSILSSKLSSDLIVSGQPRNEKPFQKQFRFMSQSLRTTFRGKYFQAQENQAPLLATESPTLDLEFQSDDAEASTSQPRMRVFFGHGSMARFARLLLLLIIPGQIFFALLVVAVGSDWSALPSPLFLACFIGGSLFQVWLLEIIACAVVSGLWRASIDPDNAASPLVCGFGDLIGTSSLALAYHTVAYFGGEPWRNSGGL